MIVFFSRESSQSLFIDINSQRVDSGNRNIDSQIELQSVDE